MSESQPDDTEVIVVKRDEPAWKLLRAIQRSRADHLLAWQDDPNHGSVSLPQITGNEVECVRRFIRCVIAEERKRCTWQLIQEIDALGSDPKNKKLSSLLHRVLDRLKGSASEPSKA